MKHILLMIAMVALVGCGTTQKIATVDLQEIYFNYWKTKETEENIRRMFLDKQKAVEPAQEKIRSLEAQIPKMQMLLQDDASNPDEHDRRLKQLQEATKELVRTSQMIQDYNRAAQAEFQHKQRDMIKNLMDEIREVVIAIAIAKGCNMVINSSAKETSAVLAFTDGKDDLTREIQDQLEATNPKKSSSAKETDVEKEAKHGFKYFPGVGWKYFPPSASTDIKTMSPIQLREHVYKAYKEERYSDAIFAAKYLIRTSPSAPLVPEMRRVVAEVYEKKGLKDDALEAYQQLLSLHPGYEKAGEIKRRMQEIRSSR